MATFNKPIATNQGIALLKAQVAGSDSITFTKTVFSSDDYSQSADSDIANLTAIQSMDLTVPAQTFQDVNGNTKVRAIGYNNSVNQAFYIKTYALYAKNKAGNEILFAVASSQTADFVPAFNNAQLTQISYTFTFAIDQTQNITLSDQHEITVTQADLAGINNAVNSNASSLTAQQSSYASSASSAISSNSAAISNLNSNALITLNNIPTGDLADISVDGIYSLGGNTFADAPYPQIYGSLIQYGSEFGVKTQLIITNLGAYYYRVVNSWGIEGWYQIASKDQISSLSSSVSSNASAISSITSNASQYRGAIEDADNATNSGTYNTNEKTVNIPVYGPVNVGILYVICEPNSNIVAQLFSPMWHTGPMDELWFRSQGGGAWQAWHKIATEDDISNVQSSVAANSSAIANASNSLSSAVNSVSISNNAVSSSIASTVSVNQSNIATNSSAISNLQSSVASNSSAIASNASEISSNATAISIIGSQATSAVNAAMNGLQYRGVWQGGYGSWGGKPDGIYTIDNGQNPIDGFFVDVAKQFTGYGVMTLTTSASGLDRYCIIQDNINQVFKQHLITSTGVYTGWTRLSDNSNSLQYMGNLPSTHLANITQTGIYNMAGITVDDGPFPVQWGQLVVMNFGGVLNQEIHDSSGTLFTRSINSWGIVGWNTNKH